MKNCLTSLFVLAMFTWCEAQTVPSDRLGPQDLTIQILAGSSVIDPKVGLPAGVGSITIKPRIKNWETDSVKWKDAKLSVESFTFTVRGAPVPIGGSALNLSNYGLNSGDKIVISNVVVTKELKSGKMETLLPKDVIALSVR